MRKHLCRCRTWWNRERVCICCGSLCVCAGCRCLYPAPPCRAPLRWEPRCPAVWWGLSSCLDSLEKRSWHRDVTGMMSLQLRNGDAAYYQSADYCRNYTSPPVSYGDSSHYLARLPGKERLCPAGYPPTHTRPSTPFTASALMCARMEEIWATYDRRWHSGRWKVLLLLSPSCHGDGVHHSVQMDAAL